MELYIIIIIVIIIAVLFLYNRKETTIDSKSKLPILEIIKNTENKVCSELKKLSNKYKFIYIELRQHLNLYESLEPKIVEDILKRYGIC